MNRLLSAAVACLAGLTFSALALAIEAPPDQYAESQDIADVLLADGVSAGIKACQDQAEIITLAATARAKGLALAEVGPTFDMTPAGPAARRVYAGELQAYPAALEHLNTCLTRLRVQLE
jgi:hypothetical protein